MLQKPVSVMRMCGVILTDWQSMGLEVTLGTPSRGAVLWVGWPGRVL